MATGSKGNQKGVPASVVEGAAGKRVGAVHVNNVSGPAHVKPLVQGAVESHGGTHVKGGRP
jgi:2-keto-3-deoxy-galactonokinase